MKKNILIRLISKKKCFKVFNFNILSRLYKKKQKINFFCFFLYRNKINQKKLVYLQPKTKHVLRILYQGIYKEKK